MPIDLTEKRLFDDRDGSCCIDDIVERTLPSAQKTASLDMARAFFERLWWHDQVVFDISLAGGIQNFEKTLNTTLRDNDSFR